ncbi:CMGC/CDKL protein kinase [Saprolegnia diclina VS20]|uniref:Cyclin-dependent kinase 2 homolog n=1 Tax=Saprolegnia diclina (strain VS20) TaxID=1156394 RepID=T0SB87_SAPDV|nr:CMGC/CDKL protein kinase [Saprolegnia diclina VS20]EQC42668.1 CMGC/CDKL protein kinase [Saprolegnia diclina VS20]|eukprot:XP_008604091.1 CMGC/CDKL protein kinase [Saprolegnia diclina VS20]
MENYENLGTIGEGTYGVVLKCRHKETGQIVAIKKFKESDEDEQVRKTAMREIRILKQLKHENIVNLIEVFRRKGKLYLVFEYVEKTILEEIEKNPEGLEPHAIRSLMWQLIRAIHYCHEHNIIHRDIKPENLLVSKNGVLKLCDFGFARTLAAAGAKYTDYVSTRWYRAPELLVGDVSYGKAVDIWAVGCMLAEITTGLPLFPGDSDIDQLYHIMKCLGRITSRQQELFRKNSLYVGVKLPEVTSIETLEDRFPQLDKVAIDFLHQTVQDEPLDRWTCSELLKHPFVAEGAELFEQQLKINIAKDMADNVIKPKRMKKLPRRSSDMAPPSSSSSSKPPKSKHSKASDVPRTSSRGGTDRLLPNLGATAPVTPLSSLAYVCLEDANNAVIEYTSRKIKRAADAEPALHIPEDAALLIEQHTHSRLSVTSHGERLRSLPKKVLTKRAVIGLELKQKPKLGQTPPRTPQSSSRRELRGF